MTWTPADKRDHEVARAVVTWIRTAREAGYRGPDWLPSEADISKSALFERLRSGKPPLPFPPPIALACPWYAVVEDSGPHFCGYGIHAVAPPTTHGRLNLATGEVPERVITVHQSPWRIVEHVGTADYIVRDGLRDTPWRWRLWFDAEWTHPTMPHPKATGGWFLQIITDEAKEEPADGDA